MAVGAGGVAKREEQNLDACAAFCVARMAR